MASNWGNQARKWSKSNRGTFKVTVHDDDVMAALGRVQIETARKPLRSGVHQSAMFVARTAAGNVTKKTSDLASSAHVRDYPLSRAMFSQSRNRKGQVVGRKDRLKVRSAISFAYNQSRVYGSFIELGTNDIAVGIYRFLRPALYDNARTVARIISANLRSFLLGQRFKQ